MMYSLQEFKDIYKHYASLNKKSSDQHLLHNTSMDYIPDDYLNESQESMEMPAAWEGDEVLESQLQSYSEIKDYVANKKKLTSETLKKNLRNLPFVYAREFSAEEKVHECSMEVFPKHKAEIMLLYLVQHPEKRKPDNLDQLSELCWLELTDIDVWFSLAKKHPLISDHLKNMALKVLQDSDVMTAQNLKALLANTGDAISLYETITKDQALYTKVKKWLNISAEINQNNHMAQAFILRKAHYFYFGLLELRMAQLNELENNPEPREFSAEQCVSSLVESIKEEAKLENSAKIEALQELSYILAISKELSAKEIEILIKAFFPYLDQSISGLLQPHLKFWIKELVNRFPQQVDEIFASLVGQLNEKEVDHFYDALVQILKGQAEDVHDRELFKPWWQYFTLRSTHSLSQVQNSSKHLFKSRKSLVPKERKKRSPSLMENYGVTQCLQSVASSVDLKLQKVREDWKSLFSLIHKFDLKLPVGAVDSFADADIMEATEYYYAWRINKKNEGEQWPSILRKYLEQANKPVDFDVLQDETAENILALLSLVFRESIAVKQDLFDKIIERCQLLDKNVIVASIIAHIHIIRTRQAELSRDNRNTESEKIKFARYREAVTDLRDNYQGRISFSFTNHLDVGFEIKMTVKSGNDEREFYIGKAKLLSTEKSELGDKEADLNREGEALFKLVATKCLVNIESEAVGSFVAEEAHHLFVLSQYCPYSNDFTPFYKQVFTEIQNSFTNKVERFPELNERDAIRQLVFLYYVAYCIKDMQYDRMGWQLFGPNVVPAGIQALRTVLSYEVISKLVVKNKSKVVYMKQEDIGNLYQQVCNVLEKKRETSWLRDSAVQTFYNGLNDWRDKLFPYALDAEKVTAQPSSRALRGIS